MDNSLLLTYEYEKDGEIRKSFEWFDIQDELEEFIEISKNTSTSFKIIEAIYIIDSIKVDLGDEYI